MWTRLGLGSRATSPATVSQPKTSTEPNPRVVKPTYSGILRDLVELVLVLSIPRTWIQLVKKKWQSEERVFPMC